MINNIKVYIPLLALSSFGYFICLNNYSKKIKKNDFHKITEQFDIIS